MTTGGKGPGRRYEDIVRPRIGYPLEPVDLDELAVSALAALPPPVRVVEGVLPFQKPGECADIDPEEKRTFVSRAARVRTHSQRLVIPVDKAAWIAVLSVAVGAVPTDAHPNPGRRFVLDDEVEGRLFLESYVGRGVNVLPSFVVEVGEVVYLEVRNIDSGREVTLENLILLTVEEHAI